MTFNIVNEVCRDLPENYRVVISLKQGAGVVELFDEDGALVALDNNDLSLLMQVQYALQRALAQDAA